MVFWILFLLPGWVVGVITIRWLLLEKFTVIPCFLSLWTMLLQWFPGVLLDGFRTLTVTDWCHQGFPSSLEFRYMLLFETRKCYSTQCQQYKGLLPGEHVITLLDHPVCSPDVNPVENLWGRMAREVYKNGQKFQPTCFVLGELFPLTN